MDFFDKLNFSELKSIYEGKRVFLTGHTGFKGTWMTLMLKELGAEVKGYALPPIEHNALYHDVRAELFCDSIVASVKFQLFFHVNVTNPITVCEHEFFVSNIFLNSF